MQWWRQRAQAKSCQASWWDFLALFRAMLCYVYDIIHISFIDPDFFSLHTISFQCFFFFVYVQSLDISNEALTFVSLRALCAQQWTGFCFVYTAAEESLSVRARKRVIRLCRVELFRREVSSFFEKSFYFFFSESFKLFILSCFIMSWNRERITRILSKFQKFWLILKCESSKNRELQQKKQQVCVSSVINQRKNIYT